MSRTGIASPLVLAPHPWRLSGWQPGHLRDFLESSVIRCWRVVSGRRFWRRRDGLEEPLDEKRPLSL